MSVVWESFWLSGWGGNTTVSATAATAVASSSAANVELRLSAVSAQGTASITAPTLGKSVGSQPATATASISPPIVVVGGKLPVIPAIATASINAPTLNKVLPAPEPPFPGGGGIAIGGGMGYSPHSRGWTPPEEDKEDEERFTKVRAKPALTLAFNRAPSLFLIDNLSEGEEEELILLALQHFGWID